MPRPEYMKAVEDFWAAHGGIFASQDAQQQQPVRPPITADVQAVPAPSQGGVPELGFGPMTPATQGGRLNPQLTQGPAPMPQQVAQGVADYGSMPARAVVDQFDRAGTALADTANDPSLANITNAGFQSGMAVAQPVRALQVLGAGYAAAAASDMLPSFTGTAEAGSSRKAAQEQIPDMPGLTPEQMQIYRIAKREGRSGAMKRLEEISADFSKQQGAALAEGARVKAVAEAEAVAAAGRQKQEEYNNQVGYAEGVRDKELSRDRRFSETDMGQIYEKTGGASVMAAGVGAGMLHRLAAGPASAIADPVRRFASTTLLPFVEGTAAGFTMANLPLAYNAFATESDNPEKRAYQGYARELPDGHPKKEGAAKYAASLPDGNPVRQQASDEFYGDFVPRLGISAIEGGVNAIVGRNAIDAVKRMVGKARSSNTGGNAFADPGPSPGPRPQPDLARMGQPTAAPLPQAGPGPISPPRWARQRRGHPTNPGRWSGGYND